ncbi:hypothetical protein ABWI00_18860 [Algihabitans albus]|uniref:hypothetical protein n=1 Tax=Algihabitans albus TaxID=2164067 RepID=UPI0035CFD9CB
MARAGRMTLPRRKGRFAAALIAAAICLLVISQPGQPLQAATPITGVTCGGGFFVKIRSNEVFWIDVENEKRASVYDGGFPMFAMAQCGKGVLTVFKAGGTDTPQYDIYHSPDCRSIGAVGGKTALVHSGSLPLTRISPDLSGVSLRFSDGSTLRSDICSLSER